MEAEFGSFDPVSMSPLIPPSDRRAEQLRRLTGISRALTYTTSTDQIVNVGIRQAAELLGAERTLLMLCGEDGTLRVRAAHGVSDAAVESVARQSDLPLAEQLKRLLTFSEPEGFLGVPLVAGGQVTGLLAVSRSEAGEASEEEEWLLSAVADQIAVAMENARLDEQIQKERASRLRSDNESSAADEASERALATLAHDLRSPLNAIDSYSELMEMEILGPISERQREALGRIRLSGRHLLAVLENVLEMTRLSAGAVRIHAESVAAATVVDEAALIMRPAATLKNISLIVEPSSDILLAADPDRLRQVLVNLLGNAVKYTQNGGSIRVSATSASVGGRQSGLLTVADTGPGIPAEKLEAIFQPYYRLPNASPGAPEGAGLGLAISRELIRHMDGEIEVTSELGHGCTFTVRLPLAAA